MNVLDDDKTVIGDSSVVELCPNTSCTNSFNHCPLKQAQALLLLSPLTEEDIGHQHPRQGCSIE